VQELTENLAELESFCVEHKIPIGAAVREAFLDRHFAAELIAFAISLAKAGVPGALEQVKNVVASETSNADLQRQYENKLTEVFAAWFLSTKRGYHVKAIETKACPIRSPHALNVNKSCDLLVEHGSNEVFCEVKDFSSELLRRYNSGKRGYDPASDKQKRSWIEEKIQESIQKGAQYLLARLPVWESAETTGVEAIQAILGSHTVQSPSEITIEVTFAIPDWFKGVYLIKPAAYVHVSAVSVWRY
jgi:hypothetical protein